MLGLQAVSWAVAVCARKMAGLLWLVISSRLFLALTAVTLTLSLAFLLFQSWVAWFTELPVISSVLFCARSIAVFLASWRPAQVARLPDNLLGNNANSVTMAFNTSDVTALRIFPHGSDMDKGVRQLSAIPVGAAKAHRGGARPSFHVAVVTLEEVLADATRGSRGSPWLSMSSSLPSAWDESWSRIRSVVAKMCAEEARFAEKAVANGLLVFQHAHALQRELAETPVSHSIALRQKRLQSRWKVALWLEQLWQGLRHWAESCMGRWLMVGGASACQNHLHDPAGQQVDLRLATFGSLVDSALKTLPDLTVSLELGPALEEDVCMMGAMLGNAVEICEGRVARTLEAGRGQKPLLLPGETREAAVLTPDIDTIGAAAYELRYFDVVGRTVCAEAKQAVGTFTATKHSVVWLAKELQAIKAAAVRLRSYLRQEVSGALGGDDDDKNQRASWAENELRVLLVPKLIYGLEQTYFRQED
ncbi:hypothetical protein CGRA01v4_15062 [Colletotrichum graminicola]|uniref:Uncharacterized protein n=1 Tax=Colletotrichum graminicola (strain M1.001 / M2 / FGSC 10212) TaxID=645133 RepID=E3QZ47_COLGM|nr:uncharacterized protein GLRG_11279 [Colletotrichum graminicola M1.001]EFQ36135.1 hypothetical protein GLRG_11279 [Colletotrichum graminicola M1.001]WDK23770.1 hypothetical protein CGRA01v4_15062 [Colletotrichum graminicola]